MKYSKEIIKKYSGLSAKELTDAGICPTCFNRQSGGSVFGDDSDKIVYEDADIVCAFVGNPRKPGHMMIATQKHYHDMAEAPDRINEKIIRFSKKLMNTITDVFKCERVYLCTMSDGPMNHYHIQLLPRYSYEERGSKNFVAPRQQYVFDKEKFEKIKNILAEYAMDSEKQA